jgi:hypothetical protein
MAVLISFVDEEDADSGGEAAIDLNGGHLEEQQEGASGDEHQDVELLVGGDVCQVMIPHNLRHKPSPSHTEKSCPVLCLMFSLAPKYS